MSNIKPVGKDGYGKGSTYRRINKKKYDENYERIFGNRKKKDKK